jgi:hypothetical protein
MSKKERKEARSNLLIHWQENNYEQLMNDGLSKITDPYEQLIFLNKLELIYKNEVQTNPELADNSGIVTAGNPHPAGFDAMIQNKRDFIKQQMELTKPIRKKQEKEIKSLKIEHPEILESMYKKLKGRYIDSNTTLEQFKAAFTEQPKESIKSIRWIKETNLLAYFLDKLFKHQRYQSKVESCQLFISINNAIVTASSLASSKSQTKDKPKESDRLDSIIDSIIDSAKKH